MRSFARPLLAVAVTAVALAGCSSTNASTAKPADAKTATKAATAKSSAPALPAALMETKTAGSDPSWCGPVVSLLAYTYRSGNQWDGMSMTDPGYKAAVVKEATLASAVAGLTGLPAEHKKALDDTASFFNRLSQINGEGDATDGDKALFEKVASETTAMEQAVDVQCPATAVALPKQ